MVYRIVTVGKVVISVLTITATISFASSPCPKHPASSLIGKWELQNRTWKETIEFFNDGTYRLDSDHGASAGKWGLFDESHFYFDGPDQIINGFSFEGNKLILVDAAGVRYEYARVSTTRQPGCLSVKIPAASQRPKILRTLHVGSSIIALAFSPDGKLIATGSRDQTIRLWEAGTGQLVRALKRPSYPDPLAFSIDSQLLASGEIGAVLFDVRTGTQRLSLPDGIIDALQFSPDGKVFATGDADGFVKIWELPSGRLRLKIKDPPSVSTLAFSPDGRTIAIGNGAADRYGVKLRDVSSGAIRKMLGTHDHSVATLAFSPDGKLIAGWGATGGKLNRTNWVTLWEVTSGRAIAELEDVGTPEVLLFSPNGRVLAIPGSIGSRSVVRLWDVWTKKFTLNMPVDGDLGHIAFSPDGKSLAAATSHSVVMWDMTPFGLGR